MTRFIVRSETPATEKPSGESTASPSDGRTRRISWMRCATVENGISALAPVAVLPYFQGKCAGKAVISSELELCKKASCDLVLGDPGHYRRFGFSTEPAKDLESPYSGEYFMALRLTGEVTPARGVVRYPPPFG